MTDCSVVARKHTSSTKKANGGGKGKPVIGKDLNKGPTRQSCKVGPLHPVGRSFHTTFSDAELGCEVGLPFPDV